MTPYNVIFHREMEEKARDEEEDRKNREFKEEKQRQAEQVISEKQAKGKNETTWCLKSVSADLTIF